VENVVVGDSGIGDKGGDASQGGMLLSRESVGELGSRSRSYERFWTGVKLKASVAPLRPIIRRS
jgi:hypothetical protein